MYQFKQEYKNNEIAKENFKKIKYDLKQNINYVRYGFIDFKLSENLIIGQSFVENENNIREFINSL